MTDADDSLVLSSLCIARRMIEYRVSLCLDMREQQADKSLRIRLADQANVQFSRRRRRNDGSRFITDPRGCHAAYVQRRILNSLLQRRRKAVSTRHTHRIQDCRLVVRHFGKRRPNLIG